MKKVKHAGKIKGKIKKKKAKMKKVKHAGKIKGKMKKKKAKIKRRNS
jgi:hypothetical protein